MIHGKCAQYHLFTGPGAREVEGVAGTIVLDLVKEHASKSTRINSLNPVFAEPCSCTCLQGACGAAVTQR